MLDQAFDVVMLPMGAQGGLRIQPTAMDALADQEGAFRSMVGRASGWPALEHAHLLREPACRVCGTRHELQVHHLEPVSWAPELELVESNLCTMCRVDHLLVGHLRLYASKNPRCLEWADMIRAAIASRPVKTTA